MAFVRIYYLVSGFSRGVCGTLGPEGVRLMEAKIASRISVSFLAVRLAILALVQPLKLDLSVAGLFNHTNVGPGCYINRTLAGFVSFANFDDSVELKFF
jgi:hypothetical protein